MKRIHVFAVACALGLPISIHAQAPAAEKTNDTAQTQPAQPDPQMKAVLDELAALGGKPIETLSPEEARKQPTPADAVKQVMKKNGTKGPEPVENVDDIKLALSTGEIPARVYRPKGDGPFPVILYVHGGGWVIADLDTYDATPRALANAVNAVVVSTHYRQAPENKFSAAHQDVYGAYQWVLQNAGKHKGDASKVAVVGESAGGNMALAVAMMAKEQGKPMPAHLVLVYPVADMSKMDTPSYRENANAKPLSAAMMQWFAKHTLAKPEDAKNPKLSLLLAGDELKGMPSATIITAQIDPLRSEGEQLAKALEQAGSRVNYRNFDGVTHEFFGMAAVVDKAKEAQQMAATDLKAAFSGQGTSQPAVTSAPQDPASKSQAKPAAPAVSAGGEAVPTPQPAPTVQPQGQ